MNKNILWGIILILLITNGLTLMKGNFPVNSTTQTNGQVTDSAVSEEVERVVAKVGEAEISYSEFIDKLESVYGSGLLTSLVNQEVVFQLAKKENIKVSEQEIERELSFLKLLSTDNFDSSVLINEEEWKREIEYSLLLDELMTKDVVISESELQAYYNDNLVLYHLPATYHIAQIISSSQAEAMTVIDELADGSDFETLAMERSLDVFSASRGGDIGYVSEQSEFVPAEYIQQVKTLDVGTWSDVPIKTEEGYAVLLLKDKVKEQSYSFEEVRDQIRRQIAVQQTEGYYSPENLWSELGVEILY